MDIIIKIPDEDLAEADRLKAKAERTDDPDEAAGLMLVVKRLRTSPDFPVLDDPRSETANSFGRDVIEEFGVITPYFPQDDFWRTLPVRLVHDGSGGLQIELGPYNLGERELRVLYRAINAWLKSENLFRRFQADREAAERTDGKRDGQVYDPAVVDVDARISERNLLSSLKARREKHRQLQATASLIEDFNRRDKIRRQRLEDALAAMKPKPSTRTAEGVAELRARLQRLQQTVGLDDDEPHTPSPV